MNLPATEADPQPGDASEHFGLDAIRASHNLRRGLISLVLLVLLVAGLLLAVPGLHGVARTLAHMQASWLVLAVGLEILSCLSYVLVFLRVFERLPIRFGARVALSELAFGAVLSLGGAGSMAIGSWLVVDRGVSPARAVERSAVLFLLTSAVNVLTLIAVGIGLFVGLLPGPQRPLLSIIPAGVGMILIALFLLPSGLAERLALGRSPGRARTLITQLSASVGDTKQLLRSPDRSLLGAIGYLWLNIGVLIACFAATGDVPPLASIVLAYQIGYLANIIPIPGSIGVLDAGLIGMLIFYGASPTTAAAATLAYHAIVLWIPALWGTIAFLDLRRGRGEPLELRGPDRG